jgi:hypothetical protein
MKVTPKSCVRATFLTLSLTVVSVISTSMSSLTSSTRSLVKSPLADRTMTVASLSA